MPQARRVLHFDDVLRQLSGDYNDYQLLGKERFDLTYRQTGLRVSWSGIITRSIQGQKNPF